MLKFGGKSVDHWFDSQLNPKTRINKNGKKIFYNPDGVFIGI